jgi:hypothetical protein
MATTVEETHEPRWHAALAVFTALLLYVTLPPKVIVGPLWLLPALTLVILVPLMIVSPRRHKEPAWQRIASVVNIALLNIFNIATIVLLFFWQLSVHHRKAITGEQLLLAAVEIWLTNVIVYALWFWELDGGGPDVRADFAFEQEPRRADFLFPQMALQPEICKRLNWNPRFFDYLFLSFTNATAFSPTDTFPLTRMSKWLMMAEAITSLVTIALIAGRAINILGS